MTDQADQPTTDGSDGQALPTHRTETVVSRRPRRSVVIAARIVVVLISLAIPLVALEVALRLFGPFLPGNYDTGPFVRRHPVLGHFHIPSHTTWVKTPQFTVRIDTNPMGLRDPRQSYDKPPGVFRILMLGDSYVEAAQVPVEQGIAQVLERKLTAELQRPVEVINGGVFGYGTTQESLLLDLEGAKYQPDLVVLFFCYCNDLANNNYRLELLDGELSRALKPYYDLGDDNSPLRLIPPPPPDARTTLRYRLRDSSLLYNVIETGVVYKFELQNPREAFNAIDGLIEPTRGKYDAKPAGEWDRSWRITERVLGIVQARASQLKAPLVVAGVPEWRMLERAYWQRDANKRLIESGRGGPDAPVKLMDGVAQRIGIRHLDLFAPFQRVVDAGSLFRYYIEGDYHWTADGHVVAADAVAQYLAAQGLLPR